MGFGLWIASCELRIDDVSCGLRVVSCRCG